MEVYKKWYDSMKIVLKDMYLNDYKSFISNLVRFNIHKCSLKCLFRWNVPFWQHCRDLIGGETKK